MTVLQHLIKNMTDAEVSVIVGLNDSRSPRNWKNGIVPNGSALKLLSAHFGKTVNELLADYKQTKEKK